MTGCDTRHSTDRVYPACPQAPSLRLRAFARSELLAGLAMAFAAMAAPAVALPPPENAKQLDPKQPVWIDEGRTCVMVDGRVVLREGVLEMFACPAGTKEHEAVVAIDAKAYLVHTGLLLVGAEEGTPVRFQPEYKPPTGTEIEVQVEWTADGKPQKARAQDWVRDVKTKQSMALPFVFAGSGFWTDPDTGKQHYLADAGDFICVSNFGAAMLDVPAPSTAANGELWFEPFTERIPPIGTEVRVVLTPKKGDGKPAPVKEAKQSATGGDASGRLADAVNVLREASVGEGSTAARQAAWRTLADAGPENLTTLLAAMRGASPLAENWLRTAIDAVVDRAAPEAMPMVALRRFVEDVSNSPRARRTAFEIIRRADPDLVNVMLDRLTDDPSAEIRYDAVAKLLDEAAEADESRQADRYRDALRVARSLSQVEAAAQGLEKAGAKVNLVETLGLVTRWSVVGPFDNRGGRGFDEVYPPEESLDAAAEYEGHDEKGPQGPFGWKPYETFDRLGEVQFNTAVGAHKGAVAYAWVTVQSDRAQDVEVRYASVAATKAWLNDELIASHESYHSGSPFDQYVATAELERGENQLLVKVCQNEQTDSWAQTWPLQLRITGPGAAPLAGVTIRPGADSTEGGE